MRPLSNHTDALRPPPVPELFVVHALAGWDVGYIEPQGGKSVRVHIRRREATPASPCSPPPVHLKSWASLQPGCRHAPEGLTSDSQAAAAAPPGRKILSTGWDVSFASAPKVVSPVKAPGREEGRRTGELKPLVPSPSCQGRSAGRRPPRGNSPAFPPRPWHKSASWRSAAPMSRHAIARAAVP